MASSEDNKRRLVQSILTSAFLKPNHPTATGMQSPYFSKPNPTTDSNLTEPPTPENGAISTPSSKRQEALTTTSQTLKTSGPSSKPSPPTTTKRSTQLALTAAETKTLLPAILATLPSAPATGHLYTPANLPHLDPKYCPRFTHPSAPSPQPGVPIRVIDGDTLDVAIALSSEPSSRNQNKLGRNVCVLNMANAHHAGGGWLKGALAQEESLCYRSALSFTLKRRFYPLPETSGVYSPTVVVIREGLGAGHGLLDLSRPEDLPVVSAVSVAAVRDPRVEKDRGTGRERYKEGRDREVMKETMRVVLRVVAVNGHRRVVFGALGCGAFRNPREEVVGCWKEVLLESEFGGGWWEKIVFAVMDDGGGKSGDGNFGVFFRGLDGLVV